MSSRSFAVALVLCLSSGVSAQLAQLSPQLGSAQLGVPTLPAPAGVLAAFHTNAGTVQNLTLPLSSAQPFSVRVLFDGVERTLFLTPHDVRAIDFQLLVHDEHGIHRLPTPAAVTFRGALSGVPSSDVAAALIDGQLHATVHTENGDWALEPLTNHGANWPRESHLLYRTRDVQRPNGQCGVHAPPIAEAPQPAPGPAALRIAELAVDADVRYYALYGSDPILVQNRVVSVINAVNSIYRRDVEIEYSITTILVRTTNIYAWNGDLCNLLGQFRNYWNANHGAIRRDVAHLFTGEGSFSGVIGCANVGVVCTTSAYGSSKVYSGNFSSDIGLVCHEMGHNWNAPHCDAQATCNIMCSGLGGCSGSLSSFEAYSANIMIAHRNSRTCLSNPVAPTLTAIAPSTVTSWAPSPVVLTGTAMGSITNVTMGGVAVAFTPLTPTTIRVTPRAPFTLGTHPIVVINSVGASNPLSLTVIGNHPSVLDLSPLLLRNFPLPLTMHSDVNWVGLPFLSTSNAPSAAPGLVSLGIGNNFTDLLQLSFLVGGTNGAASYGIAMPADAPVGIYVYTQMVTFDPTNLVLPLEVSNVVRSEIR